MDLGRVPEELTCCPHLQAAASIDVLGDDTLDSDSCLEHDRIPNGRNPAAKFASMQQSFSSC